MIYNALIFLQDLFRPDAIGNGQVPDLQAPGIEDLPGDWRVWFEERAAIIEYDGGLPRERAEASALAETITAMEKQSAAEQVEKKN
ncbi:MAG: hypothetical protein HQ546_08835 [Planctomycetes bacterium]|nr:hypothetical protein [Planctomycetota bacterium]